MKSTRENLVGTVFKYMEHLIKIKCIRGRQIIMQYVGSNNEREFICSWGIVDTIDRLNSSRWTIVSIPKKELYEIY